ncbi:MAG: flagellar basal body P-ring formation chaperone FlgA [Parvibaculales bacterium]
MAGFMMLLGLGLGAQAAASGQGADNLPDMPPLILGSDIIALVETTLQGTGVPIALKLNPQKRFYRCGGDLSATQAFGNWATIKISCPEPTDWQVFVRNNLQSAAAAAVKASEKAENDAMGGLERVVLARSVARDEVLTKDHLALQPVARQSVPGSFASLEDAMGRRLKNALSAGRILQARHLHPDWLIKNGQSVQIEHNGRGISVISAGRALENGEFGDLVKVENSASGEILDVFVQSRKKVTTDAKFSRRRVVTLDVGE